MFLFLEKIYIFFISILIIFLLINIDANAQKNQLKVVSEIPKLNAQP